MKTLNNETFLSFSFLGKITASPNKNHVAFLKANADLEDNAYFHTLYLLTDDGVNKIRKLKKNNAFAFLTDTTILLDYQKNKKEKALLEDASKKTFYTYDLEDKSLEKAFTLPISGSVEEVINEHVLLIKAGLTEQDHILYEGTEEQREAYLKTQKKEKAYEFIDELPYYFNGQGFKTDKRAQLFLYDIKEDTLKPIFDKSFSVGNYTVSEDKSTIYYTGSKPEAVMSMTSKIYTYDIESDRHKTLYDKTDYNITKLIDIDGKLMVIAKDMIRYGLNQNPDFFILKENQLMCIKTYGLSIGNSIGTDARLLASEMSFVKDKHFYFVTTIDDHSELKRIDTGGNLETVYVMDGSIEGVLDVGNRIIINAMQGQSLQALYDLNIETKSLTQRTDFNDRVFDNMYVAKPHVLEVKDDEHTVKGFALLPKNYDASKRYPTILDIHGGPKTVYGQIFYHEMQVWVNKGYIVLFANPRGSDGKGDEYADIRGKYGTIDYDDLMHFVDLAIDTYKGIDTDNLFVTGGSYGGFMTNWMVGHTTRFKAAVTQRSISNWISFYGTSDIGYYFATDQTDGHPIVDLDKLYEQSPIKYAMNINTPLLFIHSDKDYRCPMEQAQQLYAILKTRDIDTQLLWVKDETHELSRSGKPHARLKRLNAILDWFETYKNKS
ncbi:MAG: alpha/beta hydrolase family protein [Bacillota bacterium]